MKRLFLTIIISSLFGGVLSAQTLVEQIERAYRTLDSTAYIDNVILSYAKLLDARTERTRETYFQKIHTNGVTFGIDSVYVDNMYYRHKASDVQKVKEFENDVKSETPLYVLNLKIKDKHTLQVDTGKLNFNLFYFDKKYKGRLYVYCNNGEYSWQDSRYISFSRKLGRNAPKVFWRIMHKHPKCLLYCPDLDMNTVFYVLDDTVYVYKIIQLKEYTLDEYLKKNTLIHYKELLDEAFSNVRQQKERVK
ncbi:MAG: hypothetical protein IKR18_04475 [Bacteroidaceae bacterium]|nr:hypothetical protein [Bacteroidaceae bacterium]